MVAIVRPQPPGGNIVRYHPRGGAVSLLECRDPEVLLEGPAGTGKTLSCLWKMHAAALKYPKMRGLMVRKTLVSLSGSALATFKTSVLDAGKFGVKPHGHRPTESAQFAYPNGSKIIIGGLDNAAKIMSTEYDLIYCFVGETKIESPSAIQKAFKREYSGPLVAIRTARGNQLTGTPNHPILTDNGWIALAQLQEGDNVISRVLSQKVAVRDPNIDYGPPTIAEITSALACSSPDSAVTERVMGMDMDFHGDGWDGYVDVVTASGQFKRAFNPAISEPISKNDVRDSDLNLLLLEGDRSLYEHALGTSLATSGVASNGSERLDPIGIAKSTLHGSLALAERRHPAPSQFGLEGGVTDTDGLRYTGKTGLPVQVALDCIIEVSWTDSDSRMVGHVYNLQTADGYYIANNIIAHNCNEATDLTLDDWEKLTARNRYGVMPYQQVIADCNPDAPTHWLNQRCNEGTTTRLRSTHHDNPRYWDGKDWTDEGRAYVVDKLGKLTGVRRHRLLDGLWAAAEGIVYDGWNPAVHLVDRFPIPPEWPRYWVIDFGYVHPFVWQWWAVGPDGIAYRYRELYSTGRLVTDHAALGLKLSKDEPRPVAIITDHDAEDRATLERATGMATTPAYKGVSDGLQAVAARLRVNDNGKAGLYFLRDARVERDSSLADAGKPTCTEEEFPSYIWDVRPGVRKGEQPVKADDHGMDATRYFVAYVDEVDERSKFFSVK